VQASLHRWGITPSSLVLEITEGAFVTDTEQAATVLAQVRSAGVQVALDDFGTGFSSLSRLHELPVDIIKIDRSFVSGTVTGRPAGMLGSIVGLGETLGVNMIAEGVESSAEVQTLIGLGRLSGQGYYFARPMPVAQAYKFAVGWASDRRTPHLPDVSHDAQTTVANCDMTAPRALPLRARPAPVHRHDRGAP